MRIQRPFPTVVTGCLGAMACWIVQAQTILEHGIQAQVNDKIFTTRDVVKQAAGRMEQLKKQAPPDVSERMDDLLARARTELIESKLLEAEGRRFAQSNALVKDYLTRAVRQEIEKQRIAFQGENNLRDHVELKLGMTYSEYRKRLYEDKLRTMVLQQHIHEKVAVTPAEMYEFYQRHANLYRVVPEVNYSQIYLPYGSEQEKQQRLALAARLVERARGGESFVGLMKDHSAGSMPGSTAKGKLIPLDHLAPALQQALRDLKPGQVSDPVVTGSAVRLFRMNRRKQGGPIPFESVQAGIQRQLTEQRRMKLYNKLLDRLWRENYVWIKGQGRVLTRPRS